MDALLIKRIYAAPDAADGYRILVDRLWPRGVSRARAQLDDWMPDLAPSSDLRTWWNHDPAQFEEFARRYRAELADSPAVPAVQRVRAEHPRVTLLYGARDERVNHAAVLRDHLHDTAS